MMVILKMTEEIKDKAAIENVLFDYNAATSRFDFVAFWSYRGYLPLIFRSEILSDEKNMYDIIVKFLNQYYERTEIHSNTGN